MRVTWIARYERGVAWTGCLPTPSPPAPSPDSSPPRPPRCCSPLEACSSPRPRARTTSSSRPIPPPTRRVDALPAQLTLTFSGGWSTEQGATEVQVTDAAGTSLVDGDPVVAGQRGHAAARGSGIRSRHRAVEGRLERRAPDLGRVRLHRDRAGDPDAHPDRDARPRPRRRPRPSRRQPTPTAAPDDGRRRERRACRGSSAAILLAAVARRGRLPAGLAARVATRRCEAALRRRRPGPRPGSEPPADR